MLSLNNNRLKLLYSVLKICVKRFRQLTHLNLIGNPCCCRGDPQASERTEATREEEYEQYRAHVTLALPALQVSRIRAVLEQQ